MDETSHNDVGDQVLDGGAMRFNKGKPQLSLIVGARAALAGAAKVLEFGAQKYARDNWKKPTDLHVPADCLLRHLSAYLDGEYLDPDSGLPHLDHVLCNAIFLSYHTDREGQDGLK